MDKFDLKILELLQEDASRTNASLAEAAGLTPSTCLRRVRKLKAAGMIDGVVAILNPSLAGRSLKAVVNVELEHHGEQHMRRFLGSVANEIAVTQAYGVSGAIDAILVLRLKDMNEYDAFCQRIFDENSNVIRYVTNFVIRTAKETTALSM